ncbi:hypothetical protein GMORB2_0647 [Geosmithia morbida]|uniref:Uncharacterized protein n=1 Tax=Geosmithia morbida TaxID=1094350 RepID=A0A9P4Z3A0_9HYPO|nr:uncharacterized protein GMORB2_0647 [Geosmithia morbida]KAF4126910.1 hypothetical protein GMORB2_0647 [Geosmithia morbida]
MEILGAVSSAIAIARLAVRSTKPIREIGHSFRKAPREYERLRKATVRLQNIIETIASLSPDQEYDVSHEIRKIWCSQIEDVGRDIDIFNDKLDRLQSSLAQDASRMKQMAGRLRMYLSEDEMGDYEVQFSHHREALSLIYWLTSLDSRYGPKVRYTLSCSVSSYQLPLGTIHIAKKTRQTTTERYHKTERKPDWDYDFIMFPLPQLTDRVFHLMLKWSSAYLLTNTRKVHLWNSDPEVTRCMANGDAEGLRSLMTAGRARPDDLIAPHGHTLLHVRGRYPESSPSRKSFSKPDPDTDETSIR